MGLIPPTRIVERDIEEFEVDGVPMVIVNGKYVTSTGHAGGPEKVIPVVEQLIAMARKDMGAASAPAPAAAVKK